MSKLMFELDILSFDKTTEKWWFSFVIFCEKYFLCTYYRCFYEETVYYMGESFQK